MQKAMERIAVYYRVSTDEQKTDSQVGAVERWLTELPEDKRPKSRVTFTDEGRSGKDDDRPQYQAMLEAARRGEIDTIVVYKIDRFSRSAISAIRAIMDLDQLGVAFISVSQPALNLGHGMPFRLTMLAAFAEIAQIERETIVSRINEGLAAARRRGVQLGNPGLSPKVKAEIVRLYDLGLSKEAIYPRLGISRRSVYRVLAGRSRAGEPGVTRNRSAES